jgi:alpha-tubulin suppressor-like RCC1 family protein
MATPVTCPANETCDPADGRCKRLCEYVTCPAGQHCSDSAGGCVGVASIATGADHTAMVPADGTLWAWGRNASGQLGDGTTVARLTPGFVAPSFAKVAASFQFTMALKRDGSLWTWGTNQFGQLGDGTLVTRRVPTRVGADVWWKHIAAGNDFAVAVSEPYLSPDEWSDWSAGDAWTWGGNYSGQLGDGTTTNRPTPAVVVSRRSGEVAAGGRHVLLSREEHESGLLWAWGDNERGQLGDGTVIDRYTPVLADAFVERIAAGEYHSVAIDGGCLFTWGANNSGQLGDGTFLSSSLPLNVGCGYVAIAAGAYHTLAVRNDGTLWAWGDNEHGQLGDGTTTTRCLPVQIGSDTDWASVAAHSRHSFATKTNGSLWAWGNNYGGQLGDGTTYRRLRPVEVALPATQRIPLQSILINEASGASTTIPKATVLRVAFTPPDATDQTLSWKVCGTHPVACTPDPTGHCRTCTAGTDLGYVLGNGVYLPPRLIPSSPTRVYLVACQAQICDWTFVDVYR